MGAEETFKGELHYQLYFEIASSVMYKYDPKHFFLIYA